MATDSTKPKTPLEPFDIKPIHPPGEERLDTWALAVRGRSFGKPGESDRLEPGVQVRGKRVIAVLDLPDAAAALEAAAIILKAYGPKESGDDHAKPVE